MPTNDNRLEGFRRKLLANVAAAADGEKHDRLRDNAISLGGIAAEAGFDDDEAVDWLMNALANKRIDNWNLAENTARWGSIAGRERPFKLEDRPRPAPPRHPVSDLDEPQPKDPTDLSKFLLNEDGVALAFTKAHEGNLRYCHHAQPLARLDRIPLATGGNPLGIRGAQGMPVTGCQIAPL